MKTITITGILSMILFTAPGLFAQEGDADQMAAYMEFMTPGKEHKMMEKSVGTWKAVLKMWDEPGTDPMSSEGIMVNEMILGGRYLKSSFKGQVMNMPFQGMNLQAYDKVKNMFTSVWIDNMSTSMMYMEGHYDEKSKTLEMTGHIADPMSGGEVPVRQVMKFVDKNTEIMEMYMMHDGHEFKNMLITYTRQK